jgi:hypothetical protein
MSGRVKLYWCEAIVALVSSLGWPLKVLAIFYQEVRETMEWESEFGWLR